MMNVLSLFDGISCGRVALGRAGINVSKYYASEIDINAIKVSKDNHSEIDYLGDIEDWRSWGLDWQKIDLVLAGSPCQGFSFAGKQLNFEDERSRLFFVFVDMLNYIKNKNSNVEFLFENVVMKSEYIDVINQHLGVEPVLINSSLVSAQNRKRLYWCSWGFNEPNDKGISFQSFIDKSDNLDQYMLNKTNSRIRMWANGNGNNRNHSCTNVTHKSKVNCITTKQDRSSNTGLVEYKDFCRYLTREELEECQTLPRGYTSCVTYNQACKAIGNGWTVDVISHILKCNDSFHKGE